MADERVHDPDSAQMIALARVAHEAEIRAYADRFCCLRLRPGHLCNACYEAWGYIVSMHSSIERLRDRNWQREWAAQRRLGRVNRLRKLADAQHERLLELEAEVERLRAAEGALAWACEYLARDGCPPNSDDYPCPGYLEGCQECNADRRGLYIMEAMRAELPHLPPWWQEELERRRQAEVERHKAGVAAKAQTRMLTEEAAGEESKSDGRQAE